MQENIAFLRETKCNFFSEPCAFDVGAGFHLAATKANTLVLTPLSGEKKSLSLTKAIKFDKKEHTRLLRLIGDDRLLIITTRFNVYVAEMDLSTFDVMSVRNVGFKYAQNLNVAQLGYNSLRECGGLWLMACGRFLFSLTPKTGAFGLFKVFNDQVLDFASDSAVKNQIYVLTDKKIYSMKWEHINNATNTKVVTQVEVSSCLALAVLTNNVVLLQKGHSLELRDKDSLQRKSITDVCVSSGEPVKPLSIFSHDQAHLTVYDGEYAYMLSANQQNVEQIISLKDVSYIFAAGKLLDLNRKSENSVNLAIFVHHTYTDENKGPRFYSQGLEDRVDLAFAYMSKLFFTMKSVRNYNATIHNMLVELCLGGSILQHRRFKEKVLALFALMKRFSIVADKVNKVYRVLRVEVHCERAFATESEACGQQGSTSGVYDRSQHQLETC